jgi:hypothetical protein
VLTLTLLATSSCVSRKQIEAATWLNNFNAVPKEACYPGQALHRVGFFRRLDDGKFQFISICSDTANKMLSATAEDYKKLIDAAMKGKK